jgi:outer membrane protein assembly factor BamB
MKKFLKIAAGIILLAFVGSVFWFYDSIIIMTENKNITGKIDKIPETEAKVFPPITSTELDWTTWLRADLSNTAEVASLPLNWSDGLKKLWEVNYLCQDEATAVWSAPVLKGNRLIVCGRDDDNDILFCLDPENGKPIWKNSYPAKAGRSYGSGFRATPWIDEDRVYTFGRAGDLVCWKLLDGKILWRRNVKEEGGKEPKWGYSSSPLVYNSLVITHAGGSARTIAQAGYAALRIMKIDGRPTVLSFHGEGLAAIDPESGKELWNTPWTTKYDVNATTPVFKDNLIFITSGYSTGGELIRASRGKAEIVWKNKNIASHHSDPFIEGEYIYGYSGYSLQNRGEFKCLDLKTGEEKWSTGNLGWGSTIKVNDYLLCMDIKGNLFLVKPNPEKPEIITTLPEALGNVQGAAWTKPIVAQKKLFLRFKQKLLCLSLE